MRHLNSRRGSGRSFSRRSWRYSVSQAIQAKVSSYWWCTSTDQQYVTPLRAMNSFEMIYQSKKRKGLRKDVRWASNRLPAPFHRKVVLRGSQLTWFGGASNESSVDLQPVVFEHDGDAHMLIVNADNKFSRIVKAGAGSDKSLVNVCYYQTR